MATDRRRATALLEGASDAVIGVDRNGIVLFLNAQAEQCFGVSRTRAVGAPFPTLLAGPVDLDETRAERIPDHDRRRFEEAVNDVLDGADVRLSLRYRVARADGGFDVLEAHGQVDPDPTGPGGDMLIISREVGEHVRLETALRAAKEDADRVNEAKSRDLSRLSHEFRTPLNAILGFGHLLELQDLSADDEASVQQVLCGGRHLLELVNEVMDIARIESPELVVAPETSIVDGRATHIEDPSAGEVAAPSRPAVVLLVEDDAANVLLAERLMQRLSDVSTIVATSGADGIALARSAVPDLVLLDLHLPDMRGEDVVAALRSDGRTREIPIIVLSAETAPERLSGLRSAGVDGFQIKPIDVKAFLRVVADTLGVPAGGGGA